MLASCGCGTRPTPALPPAILYPIRVARTWHSGTVAHAQRPVYIERGRTPTLCFSIGVPLRSYDGPAVVRPGMAWRSPETMYTLV